MQQTNDLIKEGKNIGKANETTPNTQAMQEAQSQWEKKLKKGYVKSQKDAFAGKTDAVIEGGVFPMLAHKFSEQGHKIVYPAYAQPKFDGHRCIGMIDEDGKATLWSRTRKIITGLPHINRALEKLAQDTGSIGPWDGELYVHSHRDRFEELTHFIRSPEPQPGHEVLQYHIYDLAVAGIPFSKRSIKLVNYEPLVGVETIPVADEDELMLAFDRFLAQGYEGAMVRNAKGLYVNKRSCDLQKVKTFDDGEFLVIGVEEGRGKLAGHAIFVCSMPAPAPMGTEFRAKMKGKTENLKKYFEHPELAIGNMLTVKYQGITNKSQVPRFPVALRFKEEV